MHSRVHTLFSSLVLLFLISSCELAHDAHSTENKNEHDHKNHNHGLLDITTLDSKAQAPTVSLTIKKDTASGWNIHIDTQHFQFTPEQIDGPATANTGHAHLYVDGHKIARVYGHWYHLKNLTAGEHEVQVTLNANNHATLSVAENAIMAKQNIIQP